MEERKPANPKDIIGVNKVPFHLVPMIFVARVALALLFGMLQYGRSNWRAAGVLWSVYHDAAIRHLVAAFEGEEKDPDSGLDHLDHAAACIAILIDAKAAGKLIDDRMFPGGYRAAIDAATPEVARIKALVAAKNRPNPKHWTIEDVSLGQDWVSKITTSDSTELPVLGAANQSQQDHHNLPEYRGTVPAENGMIMGGLNGGSK